MSRAMTFASVGLTLLTALALAACSAQPEPSPPASSTTDDTASAALPLLSDDGAKPGIVLVHGAFADALGWQSVIALLDARGYRVTAVENPLTSLPEDIATTTRVIDAESANGPILVVAHSYGGAVVTVAASGKSGVKALVYVDAFAPEVGETVGALANMNPSPLGAALVLDSAGFFTVNRDQFRNVFCGDLSVSEARVLAAAQKPVSASSFGATIDRAAWKTIPSWYVVGTRDNAIPPATQRFMAQRMGAHTVEIPSSHVSFVSHARFVADLIRFVAASTH